MCTRSVGHRASTRENGRAAVAPEKDRSSLCSFTFADSRHCRMPRRNGHPHLCAFHARREAQALAGDKAGGDIAYHLSGGYVSDYDLSSALGRLFAALAQGQIKPKTAATLVHLGQTIVQAMHVSQQKYIEAFGPTPQPAAEGTPPLSPTSHAARPQGAQEAGPSM